MALVDILIPTYGRKTGLAVVLTSLFGQTFGDFNVIVSDQTKEGETYLESIEIQTLAQALRWQGHEVTLHRHLPRRGLAEQRQFLLELSSAPYVHYIDDLQVLSSPRRYDQWPAWRILLWTNPLFALLFRHRKSIWRGWYDVPVR